MYLCIAGRWQFDDRQFRNHLFFELIEPSSLNYLFRLRPAKDFGLTLVTLLAVTQLRCSHNLIMPLTAGRNNEVLKHVEMQKNIIESCT